MKNICVLSGAGISAESGLKTFRDGDGLWENYDVYQVATPEAWLADPELVLRFYNDRREQVRNAKPNAAHFALAELEKFHNVNIITQNIDDLHERAGSTNVLHLHGEVLKSKTQEDPFIYYDVEKDINIGDFDPKGNQLRPHVVWFGESVYEIENAVPLVSNADIFIIVGTSLNVYPAASLIIYTSAECKIYIVDPNPQIGHITMPSRIEAIAKPATQGLPELVGQLK